MRSATEEAPARRNHPLGGMRVHPVRVMHVSTLTTETLTFCHGAAQVIGSGPF
jgi:hypothetical protein